MDGFTIVVKILNGENVCLHMARKVKVIKLATVEG